MYPNIVIKRTGFLNIARKPARTGIFSWVLRGASRMPLLRRLRFLAVVLVRCRGPAPRTPPRRATAREATRGPRTRAAGRGGTSATRRTAKPGRQGTTSKKGLAQMGQPLKVCSGGVLLSREASLAVPSALKSLTSGFGMGPGVSSSLWPPGTLWNCTRSPGASWPLSWPLSTEEGPPAVSRELHSGRDRLASRRTCNACRVKPSAC